MWKCSKCGFISNEDSIRVKNGYCPNCREYHILQRFDPEKQRKDVVSEIENESIYIKTNEGKEITIKFDNIDFIEVKMSNQIYHLDNKTILKDMIFNYFDEIKDE